MYVILKLEHENSNILSHNIGNSLPLSLCLKILLLFVI